MGRGSIKIIGLRVRAVDRGMATCCPAVAVFDVARVIHIADVECQTRPRASRLGMAAKAKVLVRNRQELRVNGAVRIVASRATLAKRGMFEDERSGLLPVTLSARFIQTASRKAPGRLHDILAVRIVALDTIHLSFANGVVLWKMEFRIYFQMALITGLRIFSRVNDEFFAPHSSDRNMLAGRTVT